MLTVLSSFTVIAAYNLYIGNLKAHSPSPGLLSEPPSRLGSTVERIGKLLVLPEAPPFWLSPTMSPLVPLSESPTLSKAAAKAAATSRAAPSLSLEL